MKIPADNHWCDGAKSKTMKSGKRAKIKAVILVKYFILMRSGIGNDLRLKRFCRLQNI